MRIDRFVGMFILLFLLGFHNKPLEAQYRVKKISFLSDCQQPMKIEELRLKPFHNLEGRDSLFAGLLRQKPSQLFLLGDLVSRGSSNQAWIPVDSFLNKLNRLQIPVHAIPGNHEYFGKAQKGITNFSTRFPSTPLDGFCVISDSLAIVLLNSNFGQMDKTSFFRQQQWYQATLDSLDKDAGIGAIIVCTHHAPYSNSRIVGSSEAVIKNFVPFFMKSTKTVLFITGHSHNLEYFSPAGQKYFLVIGGGGGLTQPLQPARKQVYKDLIPQSQKPLYFYVTLEREGKSIRILAEGLDKTFKKMQTVNFGRIDLPK